MNASKHEVSTPPACVSVCDANILNFCATTVRQIIWSSRYTLGEHSVGTCAMRKIESHHQTLRTVAEREQILTLCANLPCARRRTGRGPGAAVCAAHRQAGNIGGR